MPFRLIRPQCSWNWSTEYTQFQKDEVWSDSYKDQTSHILQWKHYFSILRNTALYKSLISFFLMDFFLYGFFILIVSCTFKINLTVCSRLFLSTEPQIHKMMIVALSRHVKILLAATITKTIFLSVLWLKHLYLYGHKDYRKSDLESMA